MKRYLPIVVSAVVAVTIIAVWFLFVFQGQGSTLTKEQQRLQDAKDRTQQLEGTIARRQELKRNETSIRAATVEFRQNVPDTPDLAEFIWANYDIARQAGVKWMSLKPTIPTAPKASGLMAAEIKLAVSIEGGYFQTIDYLIRLEKLRRSVVVDQLQISVDSKTGGLNSQIAGRMFATNSGLPWTPSDTDLALIYPADGSPTQRGQIPGPPEAGCTPPQPGFSEGQEPNNLGNCSGQMNVPRSDSPVPQPPSGAGTEPGQIPASPGPQQGGTTGQTGNTAGRAGP
ncbi:MAG: hypothetical protein DCC49_04265 [Acidobacteria bacterium]|nr:MAG: hypothetical protein DCC49_04265 [Acidobacteriota bacterium]